MLLAAAVVVLSVTTARITQEEKHKDEALGQARANLEAADRQRERAERNSQRAFAAVNEITQAALEKVSRYPELGPTQRDLLEQALRSYQGFVQEGDPDPAARAETARAYALMAKVHAALGQSREAEAAGRKGLEAFERLTADFPADRAHRAGLADLHVWWGIHLGTNRGRVSASADHLGRAVALYEQLAAEDHGAFRVPLAAAYQYLAYHHTRASNGDKREAERLYGAALKLQEEPDRAGQVDHAALAHTCNSLGLMHRLARRPAAAEPLHRRALDHAARCKDRGEQARSHFHLAAALWALDRREEAVAHMGEAVALRRADAADHPLSPAPIVELVPTYRDQAAMLARLDRRAEAAQAYDRAVRLADRLADRFPDAPGAEREWIATTVAVLEFCAAADRPAAEKSFQRLREFEPTRGEALNHLAWYLVANPDPCFSDPARAVELAGKAVAASPEEGTYWNTLGVARYRAGDWAGAVAALEESRRLLGDGFESFNTFFLALTHWQLGDRDAARRWYDRAVAWMDRQRPTDEELRRFRAEAQALLGVP